MKIFYNVIFKFFFYFKHLINAFKERAITTLGAKCLSDACLSWTCQGSLYGLVLVSASNTSATAVILAKYWCPLLFSHREECFRIMKSEFKAIPVFLKKDNRIEAHFITFFVLLIIYRRLNDKFTCHLILIQTKITHENSKLDFRRFHGGG